tara:strand:+ start:4145 stop:5065 length:921 start_codon:yes stop_codon:yes gene_type:complete
MPASKNQIALKTKLQKSPLSAFLPEELIQEINHKSICSSIKDRFEIAIILNNLHGLKRVLDRDIYCHYTKEGNTLGGLKSCFFSGTPRRVPRRSDCSWWVQKEYLDSRTRQKNNKWVWRNLIVRKQMNKIKNIHYKSGDKNQHDLFKDLMEQIDDEYSCECDCFFCHRVAVNNHKEAPLVDFFRIQKLIKGFKETKIEKEKMYYLIEAGRLVQSNRLQQESKYLTNELKDYLFLNKNIEKSKGIINLLGSKESHDSQYFNWLCKDDFQNKYLDFTQNLYKITSQTSIRWDIYKPAFVNKYKRFIKQ